MQNADNEDVKTTPCETLLPEKKENFNVLSKGSSSGIMKRLRTKRRIFIFLSSIELMYIL